MQIFYLKSVIGTILHTLPEAVKNWSALQYIYHGLIHSVSECNIVSPSIIPPRQLLIDLSKSAISHCTCITPMNPHLLFSKSVTTSSESTSLPQALASHHAASLPFHNTTASGPYISAGSLCHIPGQLTALPLQ